MYMYLLSCQLSCRPQWVFEYMLRVNHYDEGQLFLYNSVCGGIVYNLTTDVLTMAKNGENDLVLQILSK